MCCCPHDEKKKNHSGTPLRQTHSLHLPLFLVSSTSSSPLSHRQDKTSSSFILVDPIRPSLVVMSGFSHAGERRWWRRRRRRRRSVCKCAFPRSERDLSRRRKQERGRQSVRKMEVRGREGKVDGWMDGRMIRAEEIHRVCVCV